MTDVLVLDFGVGNLHSITKAIGRHGARVQAERELGPDADPDIIVLPGVGAFGAAATVLAPFRDRLRDALLGGVPCLGVCLGMHLLFDESDEGEGAGLGLIPGRVRRLRASRIPHMGWNSVDTGTDPLFRGIEGLTAYYANSYVASPASPECVLGWTEYEGDRFPAAVQSGRTWGVQFHPEKSGTAGLRLLDNFMELARS